MTAPVATPDTQEQATEAQDQHVQTAPAVQPSGQGAGPWANDLAELFPDESVRTQVDGFLREKIQPHVTQLEQRGKDLELAGQLYSELQSNPAETYLAITEDIFGPQAAEAVRDQLVQLYGQDEDEQDDADEPVQGQLPPEVQELLDERKEQKQAAEYKAQMDSAVEKYKESDNPVVPELFHPFVLAAQGDFDLAYQGYVQWLGQAKAQFAAQPEAEADPPPNTLASDTAGSTEPPTTKKYTSIDEALTDFFAEQRAAAPPVVGSA